MKLVRPFAVAITGLIVLLFFLKHGQKKDNFYGDALGYYSYLPSAFYFHNFAYIDSIPLHFNDLPKGIYNYASSFRTNAVKSPKGHYVNQYTYGNALCELPFFIGAHIYAKLSAQSTNGYSEPYHRALQLCSLTYALLGLLLCYKIASHYFSKTVSTIATCVLLLGSNLLWFGSAQAGMAHVPIFCGVAFLVYQTLLFYQSPQSKYIYRIAFIIGLLSIMRPTEFIFILVPILWSAKSIKERLALFQQFYKTIILSIPVLMLPIIPQLLSWKKYTGTYFFDSYGAFHFNWAQPQILIGLFSASNGWLMYSPIFIFSLLGFVLFKKFKPAALPLFVIFPAYVYIIYAWPFYTYINGFGSRPMIHLYPLLLLPLAASFAYLQNKTAVLKTSAYALVVLLLSWSLSLTVKEARGNLISERSTFLFNVSTVFKSELDYNDLVINDCSIRQPDLKRVQFKQVLAVKDYKDSLNANYFRDSIEKENYVLNTIGQEFPDTKINYIYKPQVGTDYLRFNALLYMHDGQWDIYQQCVMVVSIKRADKEVDWQAVHVENKISLLNDADHLTGPVVLFDVRPRKWGKVKWFYPCSKLKSGDRIELYLWNIGKMPFFVHDLTLEAWGKIKA